MAGVALHAAVAAVGPDDGRFTAREVENVKDRPGLRIDGCHFDPAAGHVSKIDVFIEIERPRPVGRNDSLPAGGRVNDHLRGHRNPEDLQESAHYFDLTAGWHCGL